MNWKRWILIASLVVLALAIGSLGVWVSQLWADWNDFRDTEQRTLQDISQRLNVDADWETVNRHVYCELLHAGMTQPEIEKELNKIGNYSWNRDEVLTYMVYIYFDGITGSQLGRMRLVFNENGQLKWPMRYTLMGDPNPVECP